MIVNTADDCAPSVIFAVDETVGVTFQPVGIVQVMFAFNALAEPVLFILTLMLNVRL